VEEVEVVQTEQEAVQEEEEMAVLLRQGGQVLLTLEVEVEVEVELVIQVTLVALVVRV
jgi:hypothetical protein